MDYLLEKWPVTVATVSALCVVLLLRAIQRRYWLWHMGKECDGWVDAADQILTDLHFKDDQHDRTYYKLDWIDCMPRFNERVFERFRSKGYNVYEIAGSHSGREIDPTHTHIMFYGIGNKYTTFKVREV